MRIIDRYILKKFLTTFLFVVLIIVAVIVIIDITERNDKFIKHELTLKEILPYYFAFIPYMANLITPITVFIATVFVTSKLASHTEIIAMLSSGISFHRIIVPYVIGAVLIGLVSFYFGGYLIPVANRTRIDFQLKYLKSRKNFSERHIHMKVAPRSYAYIETFNTNLNRGYRFTLETIKDNQLHEKLTAREIQWDSVEADWNLKDWDLRTIEGAKETVTFGEKMDTTLNISPKDFGNNWGMHETLTNDELDDFIELLELRGDDGITFYLIERYVRYMSPFAALILTFLGVIVSARKSRRGAGVQMAFGFLLAFIYIILFIMSRAIADAGSIHPMLGVWIPNLSFIIIGAFMYHTIPR